MSAELDAARARIVASRTVLAGAQDISREDGLEIYDSMLEFFDAVLPIETKADTNEVTVSRVAKVAIEATDEVEVLKLVRSQSRRPKRRLARVGRR